MGRVGSDVVSLSSLSVCVTCFRCVPGWFPVLSPVSVLWLFFVVSPGGHGWTMLTSYVDTFGTSMSDCDFCSAHGALGFAVLGVFVSVFTWF